MKEELAGTVSKNRESRLAELHALMLDTGRIYTCRDGKQLVCMRTDSLCTARKCFTLLRKSFNICIDVCIRKKADKRDCFLCVRDPEMTGEIVRRAGLVIKGGEKPVLVPDVNYAPGTADAKRAFLRGLFMAAGSMNSPDRSYHLQISSFDVRTEELALKAMEHFGIEGRTTGTGSRRYIYLKDGSLISDMLNVTGAHGALLEFENERVLKDVRNAVNRQVNCETANIKKTVKAFEKQKEDILFLKKTGEFDRLPEKLKEVAELRLNNPEASLETLGDMMKPPVGKSGINHRLRRISEAAEDKRKEIRKGKV